MEEGKINKKISQVSAFSLQILSDWNDPLIFQFQSFIMFQAYNEIRRLMNHLKLLREIYLFLLLDVVHTLFHCEYTPTRPVVPDISYSSFR